MSPLLTLVSVSGLLDLAIKSAAVMLLAAGVAALLVRASAAWRHLVWCLSVTSLLLLPALSLVLPAWRVTWLPQWTAEQTPLAATGQTIQTQTNHIEPVVAEPTSVIVAPTSSAPTPSAPPSAATEPLPASSMETANPKRVPWPWLAIGWATGALLSLIPLGIGLFQLAALHRRSRVIDDPRWLKLLGELRRQLAVRRSVQLRQCDVTLAPLTWGALRPVLLVPAEASVWSEERRRLVLLHELAHVRRWDWLTQLVAHVACALYWFNPLVWLAARQMRIERERACDDLVLASGARASNYAQELLALAAGLSHSQVSTLVAVPMARRGVLEDRLRSILDSRRSRANVTTAAFCLAAALAAAAIAPLAMLRAAPAESAKAKAEERKQEPPVKEKPAAEKSAEKSAEKPVEMPAAKPFTVRGKVVDDATGKPITEFITQAGKFNPTVNRIVWGWHEERFSKADGSFSTTIRRDEPWTARIVAPGYFPHPVIASSPPADKEEIEVTLRLKRVPEKVRGVVLDHAGKPLKDAAVFAIGSSGLNVAGGQAWSEAPDFGKDNSARPVLTDERGRFELPTGDALSLGVSHAQLDAWPAPIPPSGEITIRLPEPARVEVNLDIDGADKEGVIFYQLLSDFMPEFAVGDRGGTVRRLQSSRRVKIANPGKLSLAALPPGKYQLARQGGVMIDRQIFEVKSGETKTFDFVRGKGARVRGKVTWPADAKLTGIFVSVHSEKSEVLASLSPGGDGSFLTERIPPGKHQLIAYAFAEQTPERLRNTSPIPPSYEAQISIDVPAEGEVKVADLALKAIQPKEAGQPPAQPKQPEITDQERIVGNWFIMNDDSKRKGEMWVISEDRILMYAKHLGANANLYLHRLDAGQNPKQIDITVTKVNGPAVGIIKGIYVLDGDELRFCLADMGKDRPAKFPEKPGPGEVLILHRQEPGTEQPKAKGGPPDAKKVLTPEEAVKQMPKENVTVQFKVASVEVTGWYTGYPATYYVHLKDGGKFTAWVNAHHGFNDEDQIQKLVKKLGIESVTDLRGKVVRVTGRVDESGLRMWVHDPANNVEVVKPKTDGKEQKPNEEKQPRAKEEKLRALIDKVLAAHGGEDKLSKLQFTMTVKHSNGETQHYFVQPPKNFRWETTHQDRTGKRIVILFPEGRRWWTKEPGGAPREFRLSGAEPTLEFWHDYVKFFGPRQVLRLKDADHNVKLLDEESKIGERAAVGVQVTGPHYDRKMYFDKESHLLLQGVTSDIVREVTFSDYKKFDGIPIAQKEHDDHFEPEVTDFKAVDKLDAKLFMEP